jgi:hypothetical protein
MFLPGPESAILVVEGCAKALVVSSESFEPALSGHFLCTFGWRRRRRCQRPKGGMRSLRDVILAGAGCSLFVPCDESPL